MTEMPSLDQIRALPKTHEAIVPAEFLDVMGHMNVMWYTHLFSEAMMNLWGRLGLDAQYVRAERSGTFALEKHARYLAELRVGEAASLYIRVTGRSAKRFHVVQFMVNDTKDVLAAIMETVGAHVDLSERRMTPFPPPIAAAFDELVAAHQDLDWPSPHCGVMRA